MISDYENYSVWALNWQLLNRYTLADVEDKYNLFYTGFNNSKEAFVQKELFAKINREYDEIATESPYFHQIGSERDDDDEWQPVLPPGVTWESAAIPMRESFFEHSNKITEFFDDLIEFMHYEDEDDEYGPCSGQYSLYIEEVERVKKSDDHIVILCCGAEPPRARAHREEATCAEAKARTEAKAHAEVLIRLQLS
jgi:hypothetical protein